MFDQPLISNLAYNAARRFGNAVALTLPKAGSFTFMEIDARAGRFAGGLKQLGISAGDRVVLHLPNGWEWIVAYHAIARLGGVVVPGNILLTPDEVGYIMANAGAKAIIMPQERVAAVKRPAGTLAITLGGGEVDFAQVLSSDYLEPAPRQPDDLFTIGYTSGTTGQPKGAMLSHGNVFASMASSATIHVRHRTDVVLSALPLPHVYGNIVMNAAFQSGMRFVLLSRFDAGEVLGLIASEKVTLFEGVPTMYYQILAHPEISRADFSSLTRCTVGGQTMPVAKMEAVAEQFGCPLLELWGMTELAGPATSHSPFWPPRHGSIGLPFPGLEVRIVNVDDPEREVPRGEPGELRVRGSLVMRGYWNNPEATEQTIDREGWLGTGDIARIDADGYIFVLDRKKDMIITAGYNIYPAELEQVIAMHRAVAMVAVTGVPDEEKGELAKAFVVLHANARLDEAELLQHCRKHLAPYKVPRLVSFVADLPKTSTGKILRRALRDEARAASPQT